MSVEPTSTYFEKVSEELERIVKEVKTSPDGDAVVGQSNADLEEQSPTPGESSSTLRPHSLTNSQPHDLTG